MKTTLAAIGSALMSLLAMVAALPYQLGDVATIVPAEWKVRVFVASAIAGTVLKVVQGVVSADAPKTP